MKYLLALLAALMYTAVSGPARAADATGTLHLDPASVPALGNTVSFDVTTQHVKNPRVNLNCYQDTVNVYGEIAGSPYAFKLGGDASPWLTNGGPADCQADLVGVVFRQGVEEVTVYDSVTFTASG